MSIGRGRGKNSEHSSGSREHSRNSNGRRGRGSAGRNSRTGQTGCLRGRDVFRRAGFQSSFPCPELGKLPSAFLALLSLLFHPAGARGLFCSSTLFGCSELPGCPSVSVSAGFFCGSFLRSSS